MKHNYFRFFFFCFVSLVQTADQQENLKLRIDSLVKTQLAIMHNNMTKHCSLMGKNLYKTLESQGYTPESARIQVCYECSQEDFDAAVMKFKIHLIQYLATADVPIQEGILLTEDLLSQGVERVLNKSVK